MKLVLQNVIDSLMNNEDYLMLDPVTFVPMMCIRGYITSSDMVTILEDNIDRDERRRRFSRIAKEKGDNFISQLIETLRHLTFNSDADGVEMELRKSELINPSSHSSITTGHDVSKNVKLIGSLSKENEQAGFGSAVQSEAEFPLYSSEALTSNQETLRSHLKRQCEQYNHIENYWKKFGVYSNFDADTSYNQNIIIEDENEKLKTVDDLLSNDCKRLILVADAGHGKSTFVHELARQWVKGEKSWTHKFAFLFLIRLSEINENEMRSLQTMIAKCFNTADVSDLGDLGCMERCLIIFDGYDEMQQNFYEYMDPTVIDKEIQMAHIIITSRPCREIDQLQCNLPGTIRIEFKGYTDAGIDQQLKKFFLDPGTVDNNVRDVLKVPLYNTLFCITHKTTIDKHIMANCNCSVVENFIWSALERYGKINKTFTGEEPNELLFILGQVELSRLSLLKNPNVVRQNAVQQLSAAMDVCKGNLILGKPLEELLAASVRFSQYLLLNKMSSMKNNNVDYPNVQQNILSTAIEAGLIHKKSDQTNVVFVNQKIADYCAAYFWFKTNPLQIKEIIDAEIIFAEPSGCTLHMGSYLSMFLSNFSRKYKESLWKKFEYYVPYLDEYATLPRRLIRDRVNVGSVRASEQKTVFDKISFLSHINKNIPLKGLTYVCFETGIKFESVAKMESLRLIECTFKMTPEEFFYSYKPVQQLALIDCKYINATDGRDVTQEGWHKKALILEELEISQCELTMVNFVSFIMANCTTLNTFKLIETFKNRNKRELTLHVKNDSNDEDSRCMDEESVGDYYGRGWIEELQKNKHLLSSIKHFELVCTGVDDLTVLFETLGKFVNLEELELRVMDSLGKSRQELKVMNWLGKNPRNLNKSELNALEMSLENGFKNLKIVNTSLKDTHGEEIDFKKRLPYFVETKSPSKPALVKE